MLVLVEICISWHPLPSRGHGTFIWQYDVYVSVLWLSWATKRHKWMELSSKQIFHFHECVWSPGRNWCHIKLDDDGKKKRKQVYFIRLGKDELKSITFAGLPSKAPRISGPFKSPSYQWDCLISIWISQNALESWDLAPKDCRTRIVHNVWVLHWDKLSKEESRETSNNSRERMGCKGGWPQQTTRSKFWTTSWPRVVGWSISFASCSTNKTELWFIKLRNQPRLLPRMPRKNKVYWSTEYIYKPNS